MAQRSRKRGQRSGAAGQATAPVETDAAGGASATGGEASVGGGASAASGDASAASGDASAGGGDASVGGGASAPARGEASVSGAASAPRPDRASRTERRNAEARAALEPLAEGERPGAVTVAAVVAVVLAVLSVAGYLSGARIGDEGSLGGVLVIAALLLVAAWGMWRVRYWAVLGFQALLAFQLLFAALSIAVASNWWAVLLCLAIVLAGGWLFWKLIRAMARIQALERERRGAGG